MTGKFLSDKSLLHSIRRWTFNPGKGGFVPGDIRPELGGKFGTPKGGNKMWPLIDKIAELLKNILEIPLDKLLVITIILALATLLVAILRLPQR